MYAYLATLYPKFLAKHYHRLLNYFDLTVKKEYIMGLLLFFSVGLSLAFSFQLAPTLYLFNSQFATLIFLFIIFNVLFQILNLVVITLLADAKGRFIENILPDVLQLLASNLRSGMTIDRALLVSARREFGPFNKEILRIGKEITVGKDIGVALRNMTHRIKSEQLSTTIELIVMGLKSGGELSRLLEQVSENLRHQRLVDQKMKTSVTVYVIFISTAVAGGAPMLFGLSSFIVKIITKSLSTVEIPPGTGRMNLPFLITEINLDPSFITLFAVVTLATSSLLAALVLGLINKGKEKYGVVYIPVLMTIALTIFFIVRWIVEFLFGGLLEI